MLADRAHSCINKVRVATICNDIMHAEGEESGDGRGWGWAGRGGGSRCCTPPVAMHSFILHADALRASAHLPWALMSARPLLVHAHVREGQFSETHTEAPYKSLWPGRIGLEVIVFFPSRCSRLVSWRRQIKCHSHFTTDGSRYKSYRPYREPPRTLAR